MTDSNSKTDKQLIDEISQMISQLREQLNNDEGSHKTQEIDSYEDFIYATNFELMTPVNDFELARKYLLADDMIDYLDTECASKIRSITWDLTSIYGGTIYVVAKTQLTKAEKHSISDWILGQNSDGLGEGFEQQEFAYNPVNSEYSGFDWDSNNYKLCLVKYVNRKEFHYESISK